MFSLSNGIAVHNKILTNPLETMNSILTKQIMNEDDHAFTAVNTIEKMLELRLPVNISILKKVFDHSEDLFLINHTIETISRLLAKNLLPTSSLDELVTSIISAIDLIDADIVTSLITNIIEARILTSESIKNITSELLRSCYNNHSFVVNNIIELMFKLANMYSLDAELGEIMEALIYCLKSLDLILVNSSIKLISFLLTEKSSPNYQLEIYNALELGLKRESIQHFGLISKNISEMVKAKILPRWGLTKLTNIVIDKIHKPLGLVSNNIESLLSLTKKDLFLQEDLLAISKELIIASKYNNRLSKISTKTIAFLIETNMVAKMNLQSITSILDSSKSSEEINIKKLALLSLASLEIKGLLPNSYDINTIVDPCLSFAKTSTKTQELLIHLYINGKLKHEIKVFLFKAATIIESNIAGSYPVNEVLKFLNFSDLRNIVCTKSSAGLNT